MLKDHLATTPYHRVAGSHPTTMNFCPILSHREKAFDVFRCFKLTLKPPYSIMHDKLRLAIWDTSFWTFLVKFGHKGP